MVAGVGRCPIWFAFGCAAGASGCVAGASGCVAGARGCVAGARGCAAGARGCAAVSAGSAVFVGIGSSTTATTFQLGSGCVSSTVFKSPETSLTWEASCGASSSFQPALLFASDSASASARRTAGPSESDRRFLPASFAPPFGSSGRCTGRVTISTHPPPVLVSVCPLSPPGH